MPRFNSITVRELIEALEDENPDAIVTFSSDYGDHGNTQQVHELTGQVEPQRIQPSAYSVSGWALAPDDDEPDDDRDGPTVVVIS